MTKTYKGIIPKRIMWGGKATPEQVLDSLVALSKQVSDLESRRISDGICGLLDNLLDTRHHILNDIDIGILKQLWKEWPKYSGNCNFPVPSPATVGNKGLIDSLVYSFAESAYWSLTNRWSGDYGTMRKELLLFLIESLSAKIEHKLIDYPRDK